MTKQLMNIPIDLFIKWLYRRRVTGRWPEMEPWGDDWPWRDLEDPWTAIATWIARHTGFLDSDIESFMSAVGRQKPAQIDQYVSRELFKWWEEGNGKVLIQKFWETYPDIAESMKHLPKPTKIIRTRKRTKRATTKKIRTRKRTKRAKRTTLTKGEEKVYLRLQAGQLQVDIAKALRITEGRVSQIVKSIEQKEKACRSRFVPLGKTFPLRDDYSTADTTSKRVTRQRKRSDNHTDD